jgi:deazaflavin-dependent oxidoreductase (nitroreductase family)
MTRDAAPFLKPNAIERLFNRTFALLVRMGLVLPHNHLVVVRGRKTGRAYSTPVNLLELGGKQFLVAGRGYTQWVRNAEAAGQVELKRGFKSRSYRIRRLSDDEKPEVLKAYLDRYKLTVQRYFPVPAGSDPSSFVEIANRYPVFQLLEPGKKTGD